MGDRAPLSARSAFAAQARRILRRARIDLVIRRGTVGLFYGLLPGLAAALLAGTLTLPFNVLAIAAGCAAAGAAAGAAVGLLTRIDPRAVLVRGDRLLGSRELSSTALELSARAAQGRFADAVIADAAGLLGKTSPRTFLGRLRLPLAPYIPLAAALTAAAILFPVDLRPLFNRSERDRALADIGEDLKNQGQSLENAARSSNLGRSLALSQELAQLGRELSAHKLTVDEALDRMSDLEGRLSQEYQLALRDGRATVPPSDSGAPGDSAGSDNQGPGGAQSGGSPGSDQSGEPGNASPNQKSLRDALRGLREDRQRLSDQQNQGRGGSGSTAQGPPGGSSKQGGKSAQGNGSGSQGRGSGAGSESPGEGQAGGPPGGQNDSGQGEGSQPGNAPAPRKTGDPTVITQGFGPSLRAEGDIGEGDMARLLARSLPDAAGSKLPDATILDQYTRQAESALARDEVPQVLQEYVKGYFTNIGMSKSGK